MTFSHEQIYRERPGLYDFMVSKQPDVSGIINEIRDCKGLDILDLGAGSGRISQVVAEKAKSIICVDNSSSMLQVLDRKLSEQGNTRNWTTIVADLRHLPIDDGTIDLVVAGWSIGYLSNDGNPNWEQNLKSIMLELNRVMKPRGPVIIFETMGTGTEVPNPPKFMIPYYKTLEEDYGFQHKWVRMDYAFKNVDEAKRGTLAFFGKELAKKIEDNQWSTIPECAGIWWKNNP